MKRAVSLLTRVPGQRVVGRRSAGQTKALRGLATGASSARTLGWFDLGTKLGADHAEQHDSGGLFAALLVRVGDFLGVGWETGQAAWGGVEKKRSKGFGHTMPAVSGDQRPLIAYIGLFDQNHRLIINVSSGSRILLFLAACT